jgi:hypothetical protein
MAWALPAPQHLLHQEHLQTHIQHLFLHQEHLLTHLGFLTPPACPQLITHLDELILRDVLLHALLWGPRGPLPPRVLPPMWLPPPMPLLSMLQMWHMFGASKAEGNALQT